MTDSSKNNEGAQPDVTKQSQKNKSVKEKPKQPDNRNPEPAVSGSALERLIKVVVVAIFRSR